MGNKHLNGTSTCIFGTSKKEVLTMYHAVYDELKRKEPTLTLRVIPSLQLTDAKLFLVIVNPTTEQYKSSSIEYNDTDKYHLCFVYNKHGSPSIEIIDDLKQNTTTNLFVINPCSYIPTTSGIIARYDKHYSKYIRLLGVPDLHLFMRELISTVGRPSKVMFSAHDGRMALFKCNDFVTFYRLHSKVTIKEVTTDSQSSLSYQPKYTWSPDIGTPKPLVSEPDIHIKELKRIYLPEGKVNKDFMMQHTKILSNEAILFLAALMKDSKLISTYKQFIQTELEYTGMFELVKNEFEDIEFE